MASYICKCGRVVNKTALASNTGNRDTAGCKGCPYLLPWGPMSFGTKTDGSKGYYMDVKGYECRMSPTIEYATTYYGSADDKTTLRIVSLDLDFLSEIQAWIDKDAGGQLFGGFSRQNIRSTDYSSGGRYSLSIACAQNKQGMAAKAALIQKFFWPDKSRRGKTPEQEKAIVLAAIEEGKAAAQRKESQMATTKHTDACSCAGCTGEQNCAQSGCTYAAKHRANPTYSAAATAAAEQTADGPELLGSADMMEATAAASSGPEEPAAGPAEAGAATQSLCAAAPASLAAEPAPAFDFSSLGELAAQAAEADEQFNLHYGRAQDEYLIACIYMARVHELTAKAGRYGGGTWTAWYQSKGISEGTKTRMLETGYGFKYSTVEDLKNLPAITRKDLNLIARQGASEQVLEAAKENGSERVQEIVAQLKSEQEARKKAEQQLADERQAHQAERESTSALLLDEQQRRQKAEEGRIAAEQEKQAAQQRAEEAEKERDGARQALRGTRKQEEKWREKAQTVQAQLDQLQSQPIPSTAIDMDEVERRVAERVDAECARLAPRDEERARQDSRDAYDAFILAARSLDNIWKTLKPQVSRLDPREQNGAKNMLLQQLMKVKEELIHECENRQS